MKRKGLFQFITLIMIGILIFIVAGCADAESSSEDGKVTLTITDRWFADNDDFKDELFEEFEEEHPDIKIERDEIVDGEDYKKAIQAAVNGENLPDLFATIPELPTYKLEELGVLHEMNDVIEESDYDKEDFEEGMWTEGGTTINDDIYALPIYTNKKDSILMFYNKEILEEAGLSEDDVPESWDELMDVSEQIQDETEASSTFLNVNNYVIGDIVQQMGSAITPEIDADEERQTGEVKYGSDGVIESAEFIEKLIDEGYDDPSDKTREINEGPGVFAGGKVAFYFDGPWTVTTLNKEGFDQDKYGVAQIPTKDGKELYNGYSGASLKSGYHISKDTEHYEEAKEFLKFFVNKGYELEVEHQESFPPIQEIFDEADKPDDIKTKAIEMQTENHIATPDPVLNNPDAIQVKNIEENNGTNKTIDKVIQGYLVDKVDDLPAELQEMSDEDNEAREEAIKEVQDDGVDIDKSDWIFPNWEPFEPYED